MRQLVHLPVDTTYHPEDFKTSMHKWNESHQNKSNQTENFYVSYRVEIWYEPYLSLPITIFWSD